MLWRCMGEWRYSSTILDFSTKWRWVVGFMFLMLYPRGKSLRYQLARSLDGPQHQSGYCGDEKFWTPIIQHVACHYTDCAITAVLYMINVKIELINGFYTLLIALCVWNWKVMAGWCLLEFTIIANLRVCVIWHWTCSVFGNLQVTHSYSMYLHFTHCG
jgi:hypothetical protein